MSMKRRFSFLIPSKWRISNSKPTKSSQPVYKNYSCGEGMVKPTGIFLKKNKSTQAALFPQTYKVFMEEAYNAGICFKLLRELGSSDVPRVKIVTKKLSNMAKLEQAMVLETIHDFFGDNTELAAKHRYRIFQVLENIIFEATQIQDDWGERFLLLALDNMTVETELEDIYQDAASNVLLAMCKHSWPLVASKIEEDFLNGIFPHRSLLYVMGVLCINDQLLTPTQRACWQEQLIQMGARSVQFLAEDEWAKALMFAITKPDRTYLEQSPEKTFLFIYYGMILRAANNSAMVRKHLKLLLETSHHFAKQREGIALTIGLTAERHLDDAWAVLDQFGRTGHLKRTLNNYSLKEEEDTKWKWASSTILLSYGQMAAKAKENIFPWVDNISSRMVFFFRNSNWDDTLKQSFLEATLMLVGAISRNEGAHSYEFTQVPELVDCLMVLIKKEPQDTLCTTTRQQVMRIVSGLCKLRPHLDSKRKSKVLFTCFQSVYKLPLVETLEKHTCLLADPPDIQKLYMDTMNALDELLQSLISENPKSEELHYLLGHMYTWLSSEKVHERQRAVRSCMVLLKFLAQNACLDPSEEFGRIGHVVGMLGMLCQDPDKDIQQLMLEAVTYLHQIFLYQKAGVEAPVLFRNFRENEDVQSLSDMGPIPMPEAPLNASSHIIKAFVKHFSLPQMKDLISTVLDCLKSTLDFQIETAGEMLTVILEDFGPRMDSIADIARILYGHLTAIETVLAKKKVLKGIALLSRFHTQELVESFLEYSLPLERDAINLWRAMGSEKMIAARILHLLLNKLQERPIPGDNNWSKDNINYLDSLAAMNTLYEIQFSREYKEAVQNWYPQLLLGLLTQLHYIFELSLLEPSKENEKSQEEEEMPSPRSTSLDSVKSLLYTSGHWKDFAHLELQGAWDLFSNFSTYHQGVTLIARAMVQNSCSQVKGVLFQAISNMDTKPERDKKVASLIFTEFLNSPVMLEEFPKQAILSYLHQGLADPNPSIRVISLQGLKNVIFDTEKGNLLRSQLPAFLEGFYHDNEQVVMRVMSTVSDVLYCLSQQGAGLHCQEIALNLRSFFDDERNKIRASAINLFGDLVTTMAGKDYYTLKPHVHQALVPLLMHLKDKCPQVVMKSKFTFYRCAVFLNWKLRHTLFCTLAWEEGLSARHFLWSCLMENSNGEFQIYLTQALKYLHSHLRNLKTSAALFIGYTICYYPKAIFQKANEADMALFYSTFEELKKDPEQAIRDFAKRHSIFLEEASKTVH
ncbi:maestro heat-like repeat family member 5 isoform X3 [Monodelphis domestica]|uniref:maestro heat-like repeat family member 5 isoform X3 n=1 Tax=Monodelphis domestica TaxID=13616 RepID=UPI0024E21239|nr:maestro heat-like repeat family member 5 isoform X3 [Monodelphis domestica]